MSGPAVPNSTSASTTASMGSSVSFSVNMNVQPKDPAASPATVVVVGEAAIAAAAASKAAPALTIPADSDAAAAAAAAATGESSVTGSGSAGQVNGFDGGSGHVHHSSPAGTAAGSPRAPRVQPLYTQHMHTNGGSAGFEVGEGSMVVGRPKTPAEFRKRFLDVTLPDLNRMFGTKKNPGSDRLCVEAPLVAKLHEDGTPMVQSGMSQVDFDKAPASVTKYLVPGGEKGVSATHNELRLSPLGELYYKENLYTGRIEKRSPNEASMANFLDTFGLGEFYDSIPENNGAIDTIYSLFSSLGSAINPSPRVFMTNCGKAGAHLMAIGRDLGALLTELEKTDLASLTKFGIMTIAFFLVIGFRFLMCAIRFALALAIPLIIIGVIIGTHGAPLIAAAFAKFGMWVAAHYETIATVTSILSLPAIGGLAYVVHNLKQKQQVADAQIKTLRRNVAPGTNLEHEELLTAVEAHTVYGLEAFERTLAPKKKPATVGKPAAAPASPEFSGLMSRGSAPYSYSLQSPAMGAVAGSFASAAARSPLSASLASNDSVSVPAAYDSKDSKADVATAAAVSNSRAELLAGATVPSPVLAASNAASTETALPAGFVTVTNLTIAK